MSPPTQCRSGTSFLDSWVSLIPSYSPLRRDKWNWFPFFWLKLLTKRQHKLIFAAKFKRCSVGGCKKNQKIINTREPSWPPFPKPAACLPHLKSGMLEKKNDWTLNERFVISSLLSQLPLHCCCAFKGPFLISTTMEHVIVQLFGMVNSKYDNQCNYFTSCSVFSVPSEAKIKDLYRSVSWVVWIKGNYLRK